MLLLIVWAEDIVTLTPLTDTTVTVPLIPVPVISIPVLISLFAVAKVKVVLEPEVPPLPTVEFLNLKSAPTAPKTLTSFVSANLPTVLPPTTL